MILKSLIISGLSISLVFSANVSCISEHIRTVNKRVSVNDAQEMASYILEYANAQTRDYGGINVSPYVMTALMQKESTFRVNALSSEGAKGLCQLVPKWNQPQIAKNAILNDSVSIDKDIKSGVWLCSEAIRERLAKAKGNINLMLDYYHGHALASPERKATFRKGYNQVILSNAHKIKKRCESESI